MISKAEAIVRLKKMGVMVADDQSIVTILLPKEVSLKAGIKDIKEKMKSMDYQASFCIKQNKELSLKDSAVNETQEAVESQESDEWEEDLQQTVDGEALQEEKMDEITDEELRSSLLSMDDDGQFTLGAFGMDF